MLLRKRKCVAIDMDRREIRMVVFEYVRKAPVIRSMHSATIDPDVNVDDAGSLGAFLKTLVAKLGLDGARALMCVGRAQAVLKSLSLPPGASPGELPSMVQFQVAKELPFPVDEAVIDFTHGPHWDTETNGDAAGEGITVLAAAVRLPVVDAARQLCTEAGLQLQRLGLRPYANLRAVTRCVRMSGDERVVLVNLTAGEAEIDVIRAETLEFSRAATVSGSAAGEGNGEASPDGRAAAVRRVVDEVARSLQSFNAVQRGAEINGCLVGGATGLEGEVVEALGQRLGVHCEMFDPSGGFAVRPSATVSAFGAALGLAAGRATGTLPFDFLNPKRPVEKSDNRRALALGVVAAVMAAIVGVWLVNRGAASDRREVIGGLTSRKNKLTKDKSELTKLASRVKKAEDWIAEDTDWLDQIVHLANTLPGANELYLLNLRCSGNKISLSGRVRDSKTVSRFAERLMEMPGYEVRQGAVTPTRADRYGYNLEFTMDVLIGPQAQPIMTPERSTAPAAPERAAAAPPERSPAPAAVPAPAPAAAPKPVASGPPTPPAGPERSRTSDGDRRSRWRR